MTKDLAPIRTAVVTLFDTVSLLGAIEAAAKPMGSATRPPPQALHPSSVGRRQSHVHRERRRENSSPGRSFARLVRSSTSVAFDAAIRHLKASREAVSRSSYLPVTCSSSVFGAATRAPESGTKGLKDTCRSQDRQYLPPRRTPHQCRPDDFSHMMQKQEQGLAPPLC